VPALWKRMSAVIVATVTVVAALVVPVSAQALTLSGDDFEPGNIITDSQFFDDSAMSVDEIQAFLTKKVPRCGDLNKCLSVFTQDTFTREATSVLGNGADPLCDRYSGADNETAAEIIYKVQKSCHISAKVLLVTLQKEQGLITNSNPTTDKLKIAMGYACPDTAPCSAKYFGFYNQVYSAGSQLVRYTEPASSFYNSKPVGQKSAVLYHPNVDCGTRSVKIRSLGTHALYIYTPYTPNDAALANLGGSGNSCSSYGNSNFWEYYQYWFNAAANLESDVADLDNSVTDSWGALVDDSSCTSTANSCYAEYDSAIATWNIIAGTKYATGAIAAEYKSAGSVDGILGPINRSAENVDGGSNGDGARQKFDNGYVYRNPDGATFIVLNDVSTYYSVAGGPAGALGWPTSDASCHSGVCAQNFEGGYVISDPTGAFRVLDGAIAEYLQANGGINSPWGLPLSDAETQTFGSFGSGRIQEFENGTVYEKNGTAYMVSDTLAAALADVGGVSTVGWPLAEPDRNGATVSQLYSAGRVVKVGTARGILIPTNTLKALKDAGGLAGYLGAPVEDVTAYAGKDGFDGSKQAFTGGVIIRGSAGAFALPNPVWDQYRARKGARGVHGWPDGKAKSSSSRWSQSFQRGSITVAK